MEHVFQQMVFFLQTPHPVSGKILQWQVFWPADSGNTSSFPVIRQLADDHYRIQLLGQLWNSQVNLTKFPFHPATGTITRSV